MRVNWDIWETGFERNTRISDLFLSYIHVFFYLYVFLYYKKTSHSRYMHWHWRLQVCHVQQRVEDTTWLNSHTYVLLTFRFTNCCFRIQRMMSNVIWVYLKVHSVWTKSPGLLGERLLRVRKCFKWFVCLYDKILFSLVFTRPEPSEPIISRRRKRLVNTITHSNSVMRIFWNVWS